MKDFVKLTAGTALLLGAMNPAFAGQIRCDVESCGVSVVYTPQTDNGSGQAEEFFIPVSVGEDGKGFISEVVRKTTDGAEFRIDSLDIDPDPSIIFGIGVTTGAVPGVFAFGFSTPIAIGGPGKVIDAQSVISYSLTDGSFFGLGGAAGVTLTPTAATTLVADDFFPATNKGVDVGPIGVAGGANCGPLVGGGSVCGPFAATNTFAGGPFTLMGAVVSFSLTANDAAGLTGAVSQIERTVPEPTSLFLMGFGMLGLAAWRRFAKRA